MFVSVVSDYYERGDLAKFLKEKRENSEAVDEEVFFHLSKDSFFIYIFTYICVRFGSFEYPEYDPGSLLKFNHFYL